MEILKIKEWIKSSNEQFEVLDTMPLAPGVIIDGNNFYINKVKRLKDDIIFWRGSIHKYANNFYYFNSKAIKMIYISMFDYDLIHVHIEIIFFQDKAQEIQNKMLKLEIDNFYEQIDSMVYQLEIGENA